jgi:hypothetical protein
VQILKGLEEAAFASADSTRGVRVEQFKVKVGG